MFAIATASPLTAIAQDIVPFQRTFKDNPPRQKAASFHLDEVMQKLTESGGSK